MPGKLNTVVENLDDVPESLRDYYSENKDKEGKVWFVLQLSEDVKNHPEVAALQRAHERQKQTNTELKAKLQEAETIAKTLPEGFKAEEWDRLKQLEVEFNEFKEKGGEIDPEKKKAHEAEIASFRKTHEQQITRLQKQMDDGFKERDAKIAERETRIHNMIIRDGLVRLLAENGVKKEVLPYVQAKLERSAKVVDSEETGEPIMVFDTDMGEVPADQFIPKWATSDEAKPFVELQQGGGASGGNRKSGGGSGDVNPWSKAAWDMRRQAEIYKKDPGRADRLSKAAGHKKALGALLLDAK
jgi:hypothetical protein